MRWFENPDFNFTSSRRTAYILSAILLLLSLYGIFSAGLNYGIDFRGGKEFVLQLSRPANVMEIRDELAGPLESTPEVKRYGSENELLIRTDNPAEINTVQDRIVSTVKEVHPETNISVIRTDVVGPRFAEDLKQGAINAIVFSIVIISLYILVRFRSWTFSLGAIIALIHDVTITLGIITLISDIVPFNLQIDQTIIAAFLTIVGYSLNDTVVIYDRIRENLQLKKVTSYEEMMNKSLNQTLSRTVITSLTTMFVVLVLFIFGGETLKGFAFTLIVGLILGTYSSLYVASAAVLEFQKYFKEKKSMQMA